MVNVVLGLFLLAIGAKRSWDVVEPADWKVTLTQVVGIAVTLFGVLVLFDI